MSIGESEFRLTGDTSISCGQLPDEAVLERVRAGETALYEVLVHRHNPGLRRAARHVLSDPADIEDVIQEVHYKALRYIGQFCGRASFGTWLTRIAIHASLSRLRHRAHWREVSPSPSCFERVHEPFESVVSTEPDPERQLLRKEIREALESAVRALPATYRSVFLLREVRELSTAEVAVMLEISEQCTKTRLHRAKALLCSRLREKYLPLRSSSDQIPIVPSK